MPRNQRDLLRELNPSVSLAMLLKLWALGIKPPLPPISDFSLLDSFGLGLPLEGGVSSNDKCLGGRVYACSSIPPLLPTHIPLNIEPSTNQSLGVILERSVSGWGATWGINFSLS